jgi:hypothetical protein
VPALVLEQEQAQVKGPTAQPSMTRGWQASSRTPLRST